MNYTYQKSLAIPLYRGKFIIILSNETEKINKRFQLNDIETYAFSIYDNYKGFEGYHVVLNFHNSQGKITNGVIAHEALHIVDLISKNRGFEADYGTNEPRAYLIDWIVDEIHKFINKNKLQIK